MTSVDFSVQQASLFAGRKNGEVSRASLLKEDNDHKAHICILARADQLITSSFFIGLLYEHMWMFDTKHDLVGGIKTDGLSDMSHDELMRAVNRVRRELT